MKKLKFILRIALVFIIVGGLWLGVLYKVYGMQTLLFLVQSPPEYLLTYTKNINASPSVAVKNKVDREVVAVPPLEIPAEHTIKVMSHTYQKLNNCGPSSALMAASTLGVNFEQAFAADLLKGSYYDKNVSPDELVPFLESQGLKAIYRVNGNSSIVEQLTAQNIPVIVEQWLVKRGSGELVGHYRVVKGYNQVKRIFTTNDSFNGPNFVIPYDQFDEWWRPFNRGYVVVYKEEQEALVKRVLGSDWIESQNAQASLAFAQKEMESIKDNYSQFNVGTNAVLVKDYGLAEKAYDLAFKSTFPEYFLWYQFGPMEAYYQQGKYERVIELANNILSKAGETEEARYYRGLVYLKQGKLAEAKVEFEKAVKANPRYYKAVNELARL